jgi:HNH endonuclease
MSAKSKRAAISAATKHLLNDQFASACGVCRETKTSKLDIHHIDGDVQNPSLENLILICASCHAEFTRGTKSEAEARMFKRMAETGHLPPRKDTAKSHGSDIVNHGTNQGIMGHTVNISKMTVPRDNKGKSSRELPGTIGEDADMRTYATYLVGKYIEARVNGEKWVKQKGGPFRPSATHGILGKGFGVTNSILQISKEKFFDWVTATQKKIRGTVFGKNLRHNFFHSWEEHLKERGKS